MSSTKAMRLSSVAVILSVFLQVSSGFGQTSSGTDPVRFSVGIAPMGDTFDSLKQGAMRTLYDILKARGAVDTGTPDWLFVVGTKEMPEDKAKRVVISVMTLGVLPKEAIEAGKRQEVFYSSLPAEKRAALPREGKWVREMVSEEMLQQFGTPVEQEIIIARRTMIRQELSRFVDHFYQKYTSLKK